MSDDWRADDWDPDQEKRKAHARAVDLGLDWMAFNGVLRTEWNLFEARLAAWAKKRFVADGVNVADWVKAKARSRFRDMLVREYGTGDVDPDCESKFKNVEPEEYWTRFGARASREFGITLRGGVPATDEETLAGVEAARAAMAWVRPRFVAPEPPEQDEQQGALF